VKRVINRALIANESGLVHFDGIQVFLNLGTPGILILIFLAICIVARLYGCGEKSEAHFGSGSKFKNNGDMDGVEIAHFLLCLLGACYLLFSAPPQTQMIKNYQIDI
jgi:O-antigen ligase